jgi:poly(A) polymerase
LPPRPLITPPTAHILSRSAISANALKVLNRLIQQGFSAYLVGGGVRDLLLNRTPKDFDVATDARPEQIKKLFRNCLIIGRRFRLVHVRFSSEIIEVTTFRAANCKKKFDPRRQVTRDGMLLRDNLYGTLEEDVWRRDFTVNALYYNIQDETLVDYCGGLMDIAHKCIRIIGNPKQRYREDPVRLLRAIRFAAKLDFQLEPVTEKALEQQASLLAQVANTRLYEEVLKLFHSGKSVKAFHLLKKYQLLAYLFPSITPFLKDVAYLNWLEMACSNTDARINNQKTVTPAFLFAVFLWQPLQRNIQAKVAQAIPHRTACLEAARQVLAHQQRCTALPRYCSHFVQDIWRLQAKFSQQYTGRRVQSILHHPRFRAAYDFFILRAQCGQVSLELANWWTQLVAHESENK